MKKKKKNHFLKKFNHTFFLTNKYLFINVLNRFLYNYNGNETNYCCL